MKIVLEKTKFHRFAMYFDYNPGVVDFMRSLRDAFGFQNFSYEADGDKKRWVFSQTQVVDTIMGMYPKCEVDPQVRLLLISESQAFRDSEQKAIAIEEIRNKEETDFKVKGIKGELYPFQKVTVEFLNASGGRAIVSSSPGMGKTAMALGYLAHNNIERTIIVCPASVKSVWVKEITKWTKLSAIEIDSKTSLKDIPSNINCWVLNYDILKKFVNELQKTRFDCIVLDECHYVKSSKSIRTKAAIAISRKIPHAILLSGTPILNRPSEAFTLLHLIDPKTWNNFYSYARDYCGGHQSRWGYDVSGATNIPELHSRIQRYFIRHKKEDVLKQLPPKVRMDIPVQLPPDIQKQYDAAEDNLIRYLKQYKGKQPKEIAKAVQAEKLTQLGILRQLLSMGKVQVAEEVIESVVESGEKVLVFGSYLEPLKKLKEKFGDKAVMITGQTDVKDRGAIVDAFQNDPKIRIFIGGIKSANTGITLTAASSCIFADYSWTPSDHEQAENRMHRPSQEASSVNIYQLHVEGTIDDKLAKMLKKKQGIIDRVIDGTDEEEESGALKEMIDDIFTRREK